MLHRHDWVKVDGIVVEAPEPGLMSMSAGAHYVAEVYLAGEAPYRATVEPLDDASTVRPPAVGSTTGFFIDMKSRKVRFDEDDRRNHALSQPGGGDPALAGLTSSNMSVSVINASGGAELSDEQRAKLARLFGGDGSGLAALIDRTVVAAGGLGGVTVTSGPDAMSPFGGGTAGPKWDVPARCPNCGARVDQARASYEDDPHCEFCREAIPVTPLGTGKKSRHDPLRRDSRPRASW